jgi:copper oxidase (laccase) domain-containing protein
MNFSFVTADWPVPDNVVAGTTLRSGGVSHGEFDSLNLATHVGDDAALVRENRRRFQIYCGLPRNRFGLNKCMVRGLLL